jgi:hypothetical protein
MTLAGSLTSELRHRFETHYVTAVSTLLDPRFKKLHFDDKSSLTNTINRITQEISQIQIHEDSSSIPEDSNLATPPNLEEQQSTGSIWDTFDKRVKDSQGHRTVTVEAAIEMRQYFEEANIGRNNDPLLW